MNFKDSDDLTIEKEYKWSVKNGEILEKLKGLTEIAGFEVRQKIEVFQKDFYFFYSPKEDFYIRIRQIDLNGQNEYLVTCKGPLSKTKNSLSRIQREFPLTSSEYESLLKDPKKIYQTRKLCEVPLIKNLQKENLPILGLWVFNKRTKLILAKEGEKGFLYLDRIAFSKTPKETFNPTEYEIEFEPTVVDDFKELIDFVNAIPGVSSCLESKVNRYLKSLK